MRIRHLSVTTSTAIILILLTNVLYAQGSLTNISVDLNNHNKVGEEAIYTFNFTTSSSGVIPDNGIIDFIFPPGFKVSGVDVAQSKNPNMNGGFESIIIKNKFSADEDTVRLTRDGVGDNVPGLTEVSIAIGVVVNHTLVGSYDLEIRTMTGTSTIIDTGTADGVAIDAGPLHHFQVVTSGNASAGQNFPLTITAQDEYNNTVTSFTNQATLTDKTGTINPAVTGAFSNGVRSENLTFTKSYTNNQVTVTYDNKSGNSALFNVLPGGLDHFTFDTISSPQIAGTSFGITITAQDQYNNTVTSFTDQVSLTDNSGTLNATSNNFTSGVLNQNVSITKSQTDNFITANHSGSGKSGTSNLFNVNAANLTKFYIDPISSPQTAGEWFSITVTAQDQNNNTVTSFNNTVTISDQSGSIAPTSSGNFSSGQWTGQVKIDSSYNNNTITVSRPGTGETGTSNTFNVSVGSLDHFIISSVTTQIAGTPFNITMTAKDKAGNTITSFSEPVTISDLTGTITPQSSGIFSNGERIETVTVTGAKQNNQIIVASSGKNGTSNYFNVDPNSIDHFTFSNISSPQTAGQSFSISIEARDLYGNKITSFNDSVNLSDKTGTLTPTSSGNFSSGSRTVDVTITNKANDDQITATHIASGKTGQSNNFNVNPGNIQQLVIRNNPGGLGNEVGDVSLNLNNQIVLYAAGYDQWNNYVREVQADWGQTGTLDLPSPLHGTSSTFIPTTSQTSGQIYADSSGMRDYTGTITVGNIHHVLIRDTENGGGNVVSTKTITADDTLRLYAAAYDDGNNYLGPAIVDWSSSGSLQPAASFSDMSEITFAPTTAPATGQIIADHETAIDFTTGTITVNPGAPVGKIVLHPNPKSIPAHSDSFSIISSDVIYDGDGNLIAEGELFTVSTTLGKITSPVDQALGIVGHQVKSNGSSQINFIVHADSIGGTAIIHANSVGKGSAVGDTIILIISNVHIVSINTDNENVSQGQKNVPVRMTVKNRGTDNVVIPVDGALLRFTDSKRIDRSGEYSITRTDTFSVIPSLGGQRVLTFDVDISPTATTDSITIDGNVNGLVNGKVVSDTSASQVDKWLVLTPPGLRVQRIEATSDTVEQGTNTTVTMTIRNDGDAALVIDSDSLTFWAITQSKNVTHEYGQFSFQSNPDTVYGHSSQLFSYSVQVGAAATLDTILINAKVSGHDVNTSVPYSDFNADLVDGWRVKLASDVLISAFLPNQMTVTSGQDRDWYLNMTISNNGGSDLILDSLKVKFSIGGFPISNQYQILEPDIFLSSGNDTLLAGTSDTLKITIDKTGSTLGTITIEGIVYLNDMISGQIIKNGITGVIVQSPAQLKIDYVRTSQSEVTVSQVFPWRTIVALTNSGGSDVLIDTTQIQNFISFLGDNNFVVTPPAGFSNSGNYQLNAGASDSLFFTVDTTGNLAGNRQINAKIISNEINSNRTITAQKNITIKVELPAHIRISKTENAAPNAPFVDSEQLFQIAVIVENSGQDGARDIAIALSTDSLSTILNPVDTLDFVTGGHSDTLKFNIRAYNGWIIDEVFTAKIDTALAENTPEPDKILISPAIDSVDTTTVQRPAKMKIISVVPSQDTVRALIRDEWQIRVAVQDSGAGFIKLDQPTANDITILMEGEPQNDYTIIAPTSFKNSQDLILSWWEQDTLTYRVTRTGIEPGLGRIKVNLSGTYLNTETSFQVADSTGIYIQPSADVFIDITEPVCPNNNQYGIGQVNTNQQFIVKSKIRNTGGAQVDSVKISLTAPGYSIKSQTIPYIPQSGFAWTNFSVTAQQMPAEQVNFIAKIESAISHEGGLPATIGLASDSVASVRVHQPALLRLSINRADSIFSIGKLGWFRVKVENLGTAEVDSSGEIYVQMPDRYFVVVNDQQKSADTTGFKIGEQITWQVLPPQYMSNNDTIIVAISKPPLDLNTKLFASIENTDPYDTLIVKTVPSMLSINSFRITAPTGAIDDTLSTFQDFWVQVNVSASENMDSIWAELTLPEGYGFGIGMNSVKNLVTNRASWKLKANENPHSTPESIKVKVFGTTGYEIQTDTDSIAVVTVKRASLSIRDFEITWPKPDSTLSIGQLFDVMAFVENTGKAKVEGPAYLRIDFGITGVTPTQNDTIKPFQPGIPVIWRLKAPDVVTNRAPITVSLDTIPLDENTNDRSDTGTEISYLKVETQQAGRAFIDSLWITSPSGALDNVLSTHQTFTIEANVRWYNCNDKPSVTLQLTGGFTTVESNPKNPVGTEHQGRVSWTIKAPEAPEQNQYIWLILNAQDANSQREFTVTSDSLRVNIVNRAEIQLNANIISPASATDRVVSTGQKFVVGAFISNSGDAKVTGNFSATIMPPEGYTLLNYHTQTAAYDVTIYWELEAPLYEKEAENIVVKLASHPKDENTSVAVVAEAVLQGGIVSFPIQTEEKSVTISEFPPREKYTIARGDTSVPMLGLELTCSGNANSNNVLLSGVKIKLKDRLGNLIINPGSVISRIAVVKYRESSLVFGQVTEIPSNNPIEILFSQSDTLKPEISNKIVFRVDVLANTEINDFQLAIDSTDALYLVDEGSNQIPQLKNKTGQKLEVINIKSNPSVIVESNFNKAFGNYPNPFGNPNRSQTKFIYYLDQDTDVAIKIYTLIGELVWSRSYTANDPQGKGGHHEGDIVWDGRNDKGYIVLNGVYIARIATGYGKSALIRIAVIK
jgi:hypothetical protein